MAPTPDNCPKEWPPSVLDPLVMGCEAAACRPHMTPERAMELIVENAALRDDNTELRTRLRQFDPTFEMRESRCV